MDGKPVAYAGDKLTCGATLQPQQSHVVGDSGSYYSHSQINDETSSFIEENKKKIVKEIYWCYGENFILLQDKSRFYNDLNIHIKTVGYFIGESLSINIEPENSEIDTFQPFTVTVKIDSQGEGVARNVFLGKFITIDTEY